MTPRSRVPINAVLLSSSQLARTLIGFLFFLFLARWLEPGDFGRYMFAFALAEIFSIFGDAGLHEYFIRELARRPERLKQRLAGILALKTLLSCASALLMIALLPLMEKDRETMLAVAAFALAQVGYSWFYTSTIAFSSRQDMGRQALLWLLEKALYAATGVAVLVAGYSFAAVAFSNTAVQFAGGALALLLVWRRYGPFTLSLNARDWGAWLQAALPFGLIVAFFLVYFRIDSVMISFFRGDEEVGQYNAAYNLMAALLFLPAGLVGALFPRLAAEHRKPDADLDAPFQRALVWLLALSLPMAAGGWLLADQLIAVLLGPQYAPAAGALTVLALALPVLYFTFLQGNVLTVIERQKAVAAVGFVNMLLNVLLNLLVIPAYGFKGAAVTTLVTETAGMLQMLYLLRRNISLARTLATFTRPAVAAVAMGLLVWLTGDRLPLAATMAIAVLFYGSVVVVFRIVPLSDLAAVFRRRPEPGGIEPPAAGL